MINNLLAEVKMALRLNDASGTAYATELNRLITAAQMDLGIAGVEVPDAYDAVVVQAIVTYCKLQFGLAEDADRLQRSYDEQKAQLATCTGYTNWLDGDGNV